MEGEMEAKKKKKNAMSSVRKGHNSAGLGMGRGQQVLRCDSKMGCIEWTGGKRGAAQKG